MYKFLFLLLLTPAILFSQEEIPIDEDSLIVVNQFEYDVSSGVSMFNRYCSNQKTYNVQGQITREVIYIKDKAENSKYNIDNIVYYHYNDEGLLLVKEYYTIDAELIKLKAFEYNTNTKDTLKIIHGTLANGQLKINRLYKYKYKKNNLSKIIKYHNGKKNTTIQVIHDSISTLRKFTYSKKNNSDSLLSVQKYHSDEQQKIIKTYRNSTDTIVEDVEVNNDLILSRTTFKNGLFIEKKQYQYYPDNLLKSISIYDIDNRRIAFTSYEIKKMIRDFGGIESKYLELAK